MKKICVVGSGRWGRNHISTLYKLNCLGGVVEKNVDVLENLKSKYEGVSFFLNLDDAILKNFDGFTIATPPNTHYEIAKKILLSGHHVLVEKPFTTTVEDAIELNDIAKIIKGDHDFTSFSRNNKNLDHRRCIIYESLWKEDNEIVNYYITGNRFLHHMVRYLVGTMVEVLRDKFELEYFKELINKPSENVNIFKAPPQGLVLTKVDYAQN